MEQTNLERLRTREPVRNPNRPRKSHAKKRLARMVTQVKQLSVAMRFHGTNAAFALIAEKLESLRPGIDSSTTWRDLSGQLAKANELIEKAKGMTSWDPGQFRTFLRNMKAPVPENLGSPRVQAQRPKECGNTEPEDKISSLLAAVRNKPADPRAYDPEAWRNKGASASV